VTKRGDRSLGYAWSAASDQQLDDKFVTLIQLKVVVLAAMQCIIRQQEDSFDMQQGRRTRTTPSAPSYNNTAPDPNETRVTEVASGLGRSGAPGHKPATTEGGVGQPSSERITVALIPKAVADLQHLQDRTSLSKTDLVNRAISLYEFIDGQTRAGQDLLLRDSKTREIQLVRLL
jgi:hypothetical protein